ncbi:hypothetical protein Ais01nite_09870 [Asanoa ishikariensis]|uniref:UPF0716 protein FxsA n=1 Tax=Asanoa ishikariensis TaxID=137265 RepID=A0A1H3T5R9_9ACTN|nr:hypothetical protein Ais01nite_09870 [Asanoa ishikariensis]SDZ45693.1 UPF0716 protein FxsA [Asanoa ishikariensis]
MRRRGLIRWLPLAILLTAAVEIAVFILVAHLIGFGFSVLLVLVASAAGVLLLRREGTRAWRGFKAAADAGQPPGAQVTDGLVGLFAGVLLAIPGLVTAALGILLALPPGRQIARLVVRRATERRLSSAQAGDLFGPRRVRVKRGAPRPPDDGGGAAGPGQPPTTGPAPSGPTVTGPAEAGPRIHATTPDPGPSGDPGPVIEGEVVEGEIVEPGHRR